MFETFSTNAIQIIDDALQIARSLNKKLVGSEHLLLAMYKNCLLYTSDAADE